MDYQENKKISELNIVQEKLKINEPTILDYVKKIENDNVVIYNREVSYFKYMTKFKMLFIISIAIFYYSQFIKDSKTRGFAIVIGLASTISSLSFLSMAYNTKQHLKKINK